MTLAQARRLFGLDSPECESLLDALTAQQFLERTCDGSYILARAG